MDELDEFDGLEKHKKNIQAEEEEEEAACWEMIQAIMALHGGEP